MKGQTDFTSDEVGGSGPGRTGPGVPPAPSPTTPPPTAGTAPGAAPPGMDTGPETPRAPGGREGTVEEADIYRIDRNRLFYLNTYRGFVIYDVADPKNPARLGRLPVFGHPVEMFVDGNTVYALLRDALYLTQVGGKMQFERHNVSQLVAIDVSDARNPRLLQTIDIVGQLREGVSRKIDKTVYVVSYIPQNYYGGWRYQGGPPPPKEQAWVYSFDVSNPAQVKKVAELKIFEGGSLNIQDPMNRESFTRTFTGVAISATSNALMVVENWQIYASSAGPRRTGCGSFASDQQAVVSIVDVSDPRGTIKLHTRFETSGELRDQFKHTYSFNAVTGAGTYFGIFARRAWSGANCTGVSEIRNTIESWDVTNGARPLRLSSLVFGKPNETVRGSAFDLDRSVAYAITARAIDPLYAINLTDRANLRILSMIDGLSGDMNVFRLVADHKFLIGIGQDNSNACTGFQDTQGWRSTKVAVSLIDVRNLSRIRLVQRQCVAVKNAEWIGSAVNSNLDQAHKMIGMHSDGATNVLTIPVHYYKRNPDGDYWWHRYETAVGLMTWDLTRYDDTKTELQQSVIRNFGTFIHPNGEVRRSIVFTHDTSKERMMINLSDTHVSVANIQNMEAPRLESMIELAPYYNQIYAFGGYMVEQVQSRSAGRGVLDQLAEFRVRRAGTVNLEDSAVVAEFSVSQVQRVLRWKDQLVMFRLLQTTPVPGAPYVPPTSEAAIYDLRDPTRPVLAARVKLPSAVVPYYPYWCGMDLYRGGWWFDTLASNWAATEAGIVFFSTEYTGATGPTTKLVVLELADPRAPRVRETVLQTGQVKPTDRAFLGVESDAADPTGFFLSFRTYLGDNKLADGTTVARFKYYGERWERKGDVWGAKYAFNIPGRLVKTWTSGGVRKFLAQDYRYRQVVMPNNVKYLQPDVRLHLLRETVVDGNRPAAELLDTRIFVDSQPAALVLDGDRLFVNIRRSYGYVGGAVPPPGTPVPGVAASPAAADVAAPVVPWENMSDWLSIMDLSGNTLKVAYEQPTRTFNTQIMGVHQNKLFINLPGDGVLILDVASATAPVALRFVRTLGYASHIQFSGESGYIAAGYFGVYHVHLGAAPEIPTI